MRQYLTLRNITIGLLVILVTGLCLMLYPSFSQYWNSKTQSRAVDSYEHTLSSVSQTDYTQLLQEAQNYNKALASLSFPLIDYDEVEGYEDILDINGDGMIGYISIEKINVELPIYHGTSDSVLAVAAGHLQGSSLPVGGTGTHAVISAHRGLPTADLFTNLGKLEEGDIFTIKVLNETLTYQVDQIKVVTPDDESDLAIDPNEDYVTLVTCTPYMINTHRLLVRGKRIANLPSSMYINSEAYKVDKLMIALCLAIPFVLICILIVYLTPPKKKITAQELMESERQEGSED